MKVTIITGASEGIGLELARQIAERDGAKAALILAARRAHVLEEKAVELRKYGATVECIPTDVTDKAQCRNLIDKAIKRFGRIDVLVNNAGMSAHANFENVTDTELDWYKKLMTINVWSVVWLTHAALPYLLETKGQVVGVSSLAGLVGVPGRTAYCMTKFAMGGFLEALRAELGHKGLRVTLAYPGKIDTNIRKQGFGPGSKALGVSMLKEDNMMSVEACARHIRIGMEKNKRDVLMKPREKLGRFLRIFAPSAIDRMAMNEIKEQFRP